jgi:hypothetical protein
MTQRTGLTRVVLSPGLTKVALCIIAIGVGGCEALMGDVPVVLADGSVRGGEPKLKPLLEMMSKGRPKPTGDSKQRVYYAISIYPIGVLIQLKGNFPETKDAVGGDYSIACSMDSAETAAVALVAEVDITSDSALSVTQQLGVFRWEDGRWVESSIGDIYFGKP